MKKVSGLVAPSFCNFELVFPNSCVEIREQYDYVTELIDKFPGFLYIRLSRVYTFDYKGNLLSIDSANMLLLHHCFLHEFQTMSLFPFLASRYSPKCLVTSDDVGLTSCQSQTTIKNIKKKIYFRGQKKFDRNY